jgi:hypothetical protein
MEPSADRSATMIVPVESDNVTIAWESPERLTSRLTRPVSAAILATIIFSSWSMAAKGTRHMENGRGDDREH